MNPPEKFRLGPFSVGDLIALGGVIFVSGGLAVQINTVAVNQRDHETEDRTETDRLVNRVQALEQVVPSEYVRMQYYREDMKEIKGSLYRIEAELKTKVDK